MFPLPQSKQPLYILRATLLSVVPALALSGGAFLIGSSIDVRSVSDRGGDSISLFSAFGFIIIAPVIESYMVRGFYKLLSEAWQSRQHHEYAAAIAISAGALHAIAAPLWFLPAAWSFYVFTRVWLQWREMGGKHHMVTLVAPHILQNSIAVVFLVLEKLITKSSA